MKNRLSTLFVLSLLSLPLTAQSTLELGGSAFFTDATGVYPLSPANGSQTDQWAPSIIPYANYGFGLKLADDLPFKLGLLAEDWIGLYQGSSAPYESQIAGKVEPSGELTWMGLTAKVSFPIAYFSPATASGVKEFKFAYRQFAGGALSAKYLTSNVWFANYDKLSYKIVFDKMLSLIIAVEGDFGFSPVAFLLDEKPQLSILAGPVQLDAKLALYNVYDDLAANQFTSTYLEPKLTYDLGSLGDSLKGLKVYGDGRWALATGDPAYSGKPFHDSFVRGGLTYKTGPWYFEGAWRVLKVDNDKSQFPKDVAGPFNEPELKVAYTLTF